MFQVKLWIRNGHNFWTNGRILEIQKAELANIEFPVYLYNFQIVQLNAAPFSGKNEYSSNKIGEKQEWLWSNKLGPYDSILG